ncbi:MAG: hypothetical protein ACXAC8_13200 [Candidatus Hodarchaeales archaeon]|jgi:hypothetical protein
MFISPTVLSEFVKCPRAFQLRRIQQFSLPPKQNSSYNLLAEERIDDFTLLFFKTLIRWYEKSSNEMKDGLDNLLKTKFYAYLGEIKDRGYRELDEKVFTSLLWLTQYIKAHFTQKNSKKPTYLPIIINQLIKDPDRNLQGKPSAVFSHSNNEGLILIQVFQPRLPEGCNIVSIQAVIYSSILESIDLNIQDYLFINYHTMNLEYRKLQPSDFDKFEQILRDFQSEMDYDPPDTPPCEICEFNILC